jgi:hypothetical protein
MNKIAKMLDEKLRSLDPKLAEDLASTVLKAIKQAEQKHGESNGWPEGYFEETAGCFADEALERAPQGELPQREQW